MLHLSGRGISRDLIVHFIMGVVFRYYEIIGVRNGARNYPCFLNERKCPFREERVELPDIGFS